MVEVPAVWEVVPRWGDVSVLVHLSLFFFLIGMCLVFQDLWDVGGVGLWHDEDGWHLQQG